MFTTFKKTICTKALWALLLASTLLTIPVGSTLGKYVWNGVVGSFQLTIIPVYHPPQVVAPALQNMTVTAVTPYGTWSKGNSYSLYLLPNEEYLLPESITVAVDRVVYTIYTNGVNNLSGIAFDPASGLLTISGGLLTGNPSYIEISGVALPITQSSGEDQSQQEQMIPAGNDVMLETGEAI